jgi:hypothetical protein
VPDSVQVTPAVLLLAVAVNVTESPGSMLLADGAVIVTPTVAEDVLLPPQPVNAASETRRRTATTWRRIRTAKRDIGLLGVTAGSL